MSRKVSYFCVLFSLCVVYGHSRSGGFPPEYIWVNELSTEETVQAFMNGSDFGVARGVVRLWNKTANEVVPVVGSRGYQLIDCLEMVRLKRRHHKVQLVLEDWESFDVTKRLLRSFDHDWIWLHFDIFPGPNDEPLIDPHALEKKVHDIPDRIQISLGWSSKSEQRVNYTMEMLQDMNRFLHNSKHLFRRAVILQFSIDYLVEIPKVEDLLPSFNAVAQSFIFKLEDPGLSVDLPLLRRIIESVGTTISYLNVPGAMRQALNLSAVDPPRSRVSSSSLYTD